MKKFLFCLLLAIMVIYPLSVDAFPLKTDILGSEPNGVMYDDWDDDDRWERDDDDWWDDDRYEDEDDDWWDDDRYEDDDDDDWDDDRWED
ncbi:hypothetical protein [Megamonas hypermegale]|uniref:hypothetical protein n=1 Tax=Megamonas hypermegale TaxID=158847 RepID=UPI0026F2CC83|nr:hypothetical protein [Megamonas hypermegale]